MDKPQAIKEIKQLLEIDLAKTGDAEKTRAGYDKIRKLGNEANLPEFTALVYVYERIKTCEYELALKRLDKALETAGEAAFYLNIAGAVIYIYLDNADKSREYITAAEAINSENYRIPYTKGQIAFTADDADNALALFKQAMEVAPDLPAPYIGIANAYLKMDDYNMALGYFERALEISEEIPHTHCGLARLAMSRDDYRNAEVYVKRAMQLDDENPYVANVAASYYYNIGDLSTAISIIGDAVERCPNDRYARLNLAAYLFAQGRFNEAIEQAEIAKRLGAEEADSLIEDIKASMDSDKSHKYKDSGSRLPNN